MKLVLFGPPGVGKTTVAERLRERLGRAGLDFERLSSDAFSGNTYDRIRSRVTAADAATDWLLDGTFYRRDLRERVRALGNAHFAFLTAELETCLARNRDRRDAIDEKGLYVMHEEFERPRNPDLTLDTDALSPGEAADAIGRYALAWNCDTNRSDSFGCNGPSGRQSQAIGSETPSAAIRRERTP